MYSKMEEQRQGSGAVEGGKIEILLFSLGGSEVFGLNVFKIREVTETLEVTEMPGQKGAMMGMVSLRGIILPVIHLGRAVGMGGEHEASKFIIAEFASRTVAFAVQQRG
ncbi:MAG: hypothetical protein HC848_05140 [Limnobacter sp.]|nr:hypothetical protein [Limnobacter sp.]